MVRIRGRSPLPLRSVQHDWLPGASPRHWLKESVMGIIATSPWSSPPRWWPPLPSSAPSSPGERWPPARPRRPPQTTALSGR